VRTAGIRNKPVDRRRLKDQDKSDYNNSGAYSKAAQAVGRARAYRGAAAYQRNRPMATVTRRPGSGSIGGGIALQQQRLRNYGDKRRSDFQIKPPSPKGDLYS